MENGSCGRRCPALTCISISLEALTMKALSLSKGGLLFSCSPAQSIESRERG
jgi:hypothetical protein